MRILIDCSHTAIFGGNTGIQRVVRNIVNEATKIKTSSSQNISIQPVILCFGSYKKIERIFLRSNKIIRFVKKIKKLIWIEKKDGEKNHGEIKKLQNTNIVNNLLALNFLLNEKIIFNSEDILFLPEGSNVTYNQNLLNNIKKTGVKVGFLCHDLIYQKYPQYYFENDRIIFLNYLKDIINLSNFCLVGSKSVFDDISKYIESKYEKKTIFIDSFKFGYNLDYYSKNKIISDEISHIFNNHSTYIIVSTIEPRKNHMYLLDAFDEIWRSGIKCNLIIIGKVGWMCDQIITRIKNHEQYGKQLFMLNNASDTELDYCYNNAKSLITPSVTEGFGLPIIEALSHHTPVLASDIPVFREVGSDFCTYFDLNNSKNLADMIIKWEKNDQAPAHRSLDEFRWPTWKESTQELISKIEKMCR